MSPVRGAITRRLLPIVLPLAALGMGAAPYVPWEDLTGTDALYDLATRFAIVDDHECEGAKFHSPQPLVVREVVVGPAIEGRTAWLCSTCADNLAEKFMMLPFDI